MEFYIWNILEGKHLPDVGHLGLPSVGPEQTVRARGFPVRALKQETQQPCSKSHSPNTQALVLITQLGVSRIDFGRFSLTGESPFLIGTALRLETRGWQEG